MASQPMQPIERDEEGTARFKQNAIVRFLLDEYKPGLNAIASMPFSRDDYQHLMQLIGYSVSGYGDLSCAWPEIVNTADDMADAL
jgi:hypothetical protein